MRAWSLLKENGTWSIRRWEGRRYVRLPIQQYKAIRHDETALKSFLSRLNKPYETKTVVDFKHAWISPELLEEYALFRSLQVSNQRNARCELQYLKRHALGFFINHLNLISPFEWHRVQGSTWAKYLIEDKSVPKSQSGKKQVIQSLQRFIAWLHIKRPNEGYNQLTFNPLSKAYYKKLKADKFIHKSIPTEKEWYLILESANELKPYILLANGFGLRRCEILGLKLQDIRQSYLSIERQYINCHSTGPLKGRCIRKIPYWFVTPSETYTWINSLKIITPEKLDKLWRLLMKKLSFSYRLHDLRHRFITNAWQIPGNIPRNIQLAAGHTSIETTMKYSHDIRDLNDQVFKP